MNIKNKCSTEVFISNTVNDHIRKVKRKILDSTLELDSEDGN